jgi:hypothetical protein
MPGRVRIYSLALIAVGAGLLIGSLVDSPQFPDMARYLACVSLACIGSTMKVRLPGLHGTISVNFVFILMGVAQLSLAETLTLVCAATLVQCMWRPKTRPKGIQVLFNVATLVVSAATAWTTAHMVPGEPYALIALAPAATMFFIANTGMVSVVLALLSGKPVAAVWKQCHLWSFPYYLAGAAIAALISASSQTAGWRLSLLALPMVFLVYSYFSAYVSAHTERTEAP